MHRPNWGTSRITPWWRLRRLSVCPSIQVLPILAFWSHRPFTTISHPPKMCLWNCWCCGHERRIFGGAAKPSRCGRINFCGVWPKNLIPLDIMLSVEAFGKVWSWSEKVDRAGRTYQVRPHLPTDMPRVKIFCEAYFLHPDSELGKWYVHFDFLDKPVTMV
jgi:hypothetical protein